MLQSAQSCIGVLNMYSHTIIAVLSTKSKWIIIGTRLATTHTIVLNPLSSFSGLLCILAKYWSIIYRGVAVYSYLGIIYLFGGNTSSSLLSLANPAKHHFPPLYLLLPMLTHIQQHSHTLHRLAPFYFWPSLYLHMLQLLCPLSEVISNKMKSNGPRIDPCSTPRLMSSHSDLAPPTHTLCLLPCLKPLQLLSSHTIPSQFLK